MSTRHELLGKMVPSNRGIVPVTAGPVPSRVRGRNAPGTGHLSSEPFRHLSRAAREDNPVQLGTCAHDGGTLSRLGLRQRPHSIRSSRGTTRRPANRATGRTTKWRGHCWLPDRLILGRFRCARPRPVPSFQLEKGLNRKAIHRRDHSPRRRAPARVGKRGHPTRCVSAGCSPYGRLRW